ncbi:MAG: DUF167 domain-containing protein [Ilumatobacteraceae bacterium]
MAHADGALVAVRAVPGASRAKVDGLHGDEVRIRVCSPPVDGRANDEVAEVLAEALGLRPREVVLVGGRTSRSKRFLVAMPADVVFHRLGLRRGFDPPAG